MGPENEFDDVIYIDDGITVNRRIVNIDLTLESIENSNTGVCEMKGTLGSPLRSNNWRKMHGLCMDRGSVCRTWRRLTNMIIDVYTPDIWNTKDYRRTR